VGATEVGTPTGYKANNTTFAYNHTTASGTDCLVVGTAVYAGAVTAVTFNGVSLTQVTSAAGTFDGGSAHIAVWILRNPGIGLFSVAITTAGSELSSGAINCSGVDTSSDANAATGGAATSGSSSNPSITAGGSPTANDLVIDAIGWYSADVSAVGADQTSRVDQSSSDFRTTIAMSRQAGNISPATMSWTLSGSVAWGSAVAVIKGAGGGGGGSSAPMFRGS